MPKKPSPRGTSLVATVVGVLAAAAFVLYQLGVIDLEGLDTSAGDAPSSDAAASASDTDQASAWLDEIRIEEEEDPPGYDRAMFPHWSTVGDGCNTRETVLARDGRDVEADDECRAVSGSWDSVYDGESFTDAGDLDIDHMVPLKEGWRSGAHAWTTEEREQFANDLERSPQLWAASASSNRSKGDADPSDWMPPSEDFHCEYVAAWIEVKHEWDLTVDPDEEAALREVLSGC
ncbi:HNH endonuclease family protein [Nocardiopsis sp. YSL2]|uniref:HNH endonuclease family protein n=1 Tax=Nocardiopsis sp. YSL2 TaxID=2939492 RepID=UPI0026F41FD2|nr:HNH endonuclease family protein [Nocardiopsis sp. YSL2]